MIGSLISHDRSKYGASLKQLIQIQLYIIIDQFQNKLNSLKQLLEQCIIIYQFQRKYRRIRLKLISILKKTVLWSVLIAYFVQYMIFDPSWSDSVYQYIDQF